MRSFLLLSLSLFLSPTFSKAPDWGKEAQLPGEQFCNDVHGEEICYSDGNRSNIYSLSEIELGEAIKRGAAHALNYPVTITRMRLPKDTMERYFNSDSESPIRRFIFKIAKKFSSFNSFNDVFKYLGLHDYPKSPQEISPNLIPPMGELENYPMGVSRFVTNGHESFTFGCAACHNSNLFGVKVMGLTNRFSQANHTFFVAKKALKATPTFLFKAITNPTEHDLNIFKEMKSAMNYVQTKEPLVLGLDTSLALVGLSLATRGLDEYATMKVSSRADSEERRERLRKSPLNHLPADSKPAVWWNLKYKTKFLSDGSIISGNPIYTNFLWNEIGRGVDLRQLETWLLENNQTIKDLTSYVFNTKPPRFNDFFPNRIRIDLAKSGEKLFKKTCQGCHGTYEKGWSTQDSHQLSYDELIKTTKVWYQTQTEIIDVKTDHFRKDAMKYFYKDLNRLKISKTINTVVKPQNGYVPPPLAGIWARWPYLHNNSIPTLYDVITPDYDRPVYYVSVPSDNKEADFDFEKNGYPVPEKIRKPYQTDKKYFFNTKRRGLSNKGHTKMLLNEDGSEKYTHQNKLEIVEFLKTL